jgi:hypothetical protein
MLKIALLADIEYELRPNALHGPAAFAHELAASLFQSAGETGGISVDLVARKHSISEVPLISIDAGNLGGKHEDPLDRYAFQDAIYMQLVLSGALDDYALVHCLAPVVSPLVLLSAKGIPVVQTILTNEAHPSAVLPPQLLGRGARQVQVGPYMLDETKAVIPPSVDLYQFYPEAAPADDLLLWMGKENEEEIARSIAGSLGLAFMAFNETDAVAQLKDARLLLHTHAGDTPCDAVWLARALACGTPFAAWADKQLQSFFTRPELGAFAERNNIDQLFENIRDLPARNTGAGPRREYALAFFGRRGAAARYREVYKNLLSRNEQG